MENPEESQNNNNIKKSTWGSFDDSSLSDSKRSEEPHYQGALELDETLKNKLIDMPEVLEFVEKLQRIIKKQVKKIIKWKMKVKELSEEYGLYYDGSSGTYLTYNQETQTYDFHSQVSTDLAPDVPARRKSKRKNVKTKKTKGAKRRKTSKDEEQEDGECSDSSLGSSGGDSLRSESSELSKQWPPCMRLIVETTEIPKIKTGSLFIITCDGGSLGREGSQHSVCLPDLNVSKHHLKIQYEKETFKYTIVDLGSRNGTFLNGKRISSSKQESEPIEVPHGSKIQVGSTVLMCHIHEGTQTCGHCEPGLLIEEEREQLLPRTTAGKQNTSQQFKSELRRLKKHHGLLGSGSEESAKVAEGYTDRAQKRRNEVGSQNPYEKTQAASVNESISAENKGFKLLSKMGWKEGDSLGKDNTGLKQPIPLVSNVGTSGIGASVPTNVSVPVEVIMKNSIWKKTQERFDVLPDKSDIFHDENDSDS
ncbi:angiogenic factor with G patch and FHA domains 1 isoform X2 [Anthonomus grandis grandis]|uniref:angiogenic factor with G patch and FHA domains 1 isoform X2 n=1 Tax=Anthonomus grandis grandis TaxID=2921223 RepID=UPI0021653C59|nr:angiogenic factor with G patch and FHA domains 1 isoform X2 [Anthonomus grandis grandis]